MQFNNPICPSYVLMDGLDHKIYFKSYRRPPQFYERLNNNAHNISHTTRPRYHPNDGRFQTFPIKDQKAQNRNLEVIEREEVINSVPKLPPVVTSTSTNIQSFAPSKNQFGQPPNYVNYNGRIVDIRALNEYQQRLQNPSLLQRFQNFLIGTGQVLTQALG